MVKPRINIIIYRIFEYYVIMKIRRRFSSVTISGQFHDSGKSILLISNHNSWWDGLWASYVNTKILGRRFHFMILEEQLRKHPYFQFVGGFSVNKGSRDILETLRYTLEILNNPRNMVLLFPQGKLQSLYMRDFVFEKGAAALLKRAGEGIQVVMMAAMVDYFSRVKPGLFIYLEEYSPGSAESLEEAYNRFYHASMEKQLKREEP